MGTITRNFANNILGTGEVDATDGVNGTIPATNVADASLNNVTSLPSSVGYAIKSVASDPPSLNAGEIFYNSTSGAFKALVNVEAWSSGGNLITGRFVGGAFGTQTAAVYTVGQGPTPATPSTNLTEEYNGTGWSAGTNYPTSLGGTGGTAGTQTNGLHAGGYPGITASNLYDGTSWTATGSLNNGGDNIGNCGTGTTSDVIFCIGRTPATGNSGNNQSETFDGSTFSSAPNYNTNRMLGVAMGSGTGTAGLIFGGFIDPSPGPTGLTATEEYNGTSWTSVNGLNRSDGLSSGWGTQTNTIKATGQPGYVFTEGYNGTTWSNLSDMTTGGPYGNSAGSTGNAGLVTGLGPTRSSTEEYNVSTNTITAAAWASGGALNNARRHATGTGLQTAALAAGGYSGTATMNNTEEYDGSSWTNSPTMPEGKRLQATFGTQTAALDATGIGSSTYSTTTQSYDGSTWTSGLGAVNTGRYANNCFGTSTAGLINGGQPSPAGFTNASEDWDGTSWTAGTASSDTKYYGYHSGTQTAGLIAGGLAPPVSNSTEEWNGSAWTSGGNLLYPGYQGNSSSNGTQTSTIVFGGDVNGSANSAVTQGYDGSAWSTRPSLGTGREGMSGAGTSSSALAAGGSPGAVTTTEEFTGETVTQVAKTLSSS